MFITISLFDLLNESLIKSIIHNVLPNVLALFTNYPWIKLDLLNTKSSISALNNL